MAEITSYSGADLQKLANAISDAVDNIVAQYKQVQAASQSSGLQGTAGELLATTFSETDGIMAELEAKANELNDEIDAKFASQANTDAEVEEIANR